MHKLLTIKKITRNVKFQLCYAHAHHSIMYVNNILELLTRMTTTILVFAAVKFVFIDDLSKNSDAKKAVLIVFKYLSAYKRFIRELSNVKLR